MNVWRYLISAMAGPSMMRLAPFGLLLQFLIPWTDSLRHCEAAIVYRE